MQPCSLLTNSHIQSSYKINLSLCSSIWVQLLNRQQNHTALIRIPCAAFRPTTQKVNKPGEKFKQHKIDVLLEETSEHWINVS